MPAYNSPKLGCALAALTLWLSACSEGVTHTSNQPPSADAGATQLLDLGVDVVLSGGASNDPDGDELEYSWEQTGGIAVILMTPDEASTEFIAPSEVTDLVFNLVVRDTSGQSSSDSVTVYIRNIPTVELVLEADNMSEADAQLGLGLLLNRQASSNITVNLDFGGSAVRTDDYNAESSIVIPTGSLLYEGNIMSIDNDLDDGNKSVLITIDSASLASYDSSLTYALTITDDDTTPDFTSADTHTSDDRLQDTEYQAIATDADGDSLTFSLVGGDDVDKFTIGEQNGSLYFNSSYFAEYYDDEGQTTPLAALPADANGDNLYLVTLRVSDGANHDELNLGITLIENDNLFAPQITSDTSGTTAAENSTSVFYTAQAEDVDGSNLTWSVGGKDGSHFEFDGAELRFSSAPDYEQPKDIEPRDNVYETNISVEDGRYSASAELNVTVSNNSEPAATLSVIDSALYENNLSLTWTIVNDAISYHIYQGDSADCVANPEVYSCPQRIHSVSADFTTELIDELTSYTEYFFVMVAELSDNSYGDFSATASARTIIAAPSAVSFRAVSNSEINVSWGTVDQAASYGLYRYSNADCAVANYLSCTDVLYVQNLTATDYLDVGLEPDTLYYYQLESVDVDGGVSLASPQYSFSTASYLSSNDTGIQFAGLQPDGDEDPCTADPEDSTATGAIPVPQDCHHGRDYREAQGELSKIGAGLAAFDFTKLDASGIELDASATSWSCVRDNLTGLTWEVKSTDLQNITYRWGGTSALAGGSGDYHNDWNSLIDSFNTAVTCGYSDWRVPSLDELLGIAYYGSDSTTTRIDIGYFPRASAADYWTSLPFGFNGIAFDPVLGVPQALDTDTVARLRLVRGVERGTSWDDERYQDNGDGTIIDLQTNLVWSKCVRNTEYDAEAAACQGNSAIAVAWDVALDQAESFTLGDYSDWRLPNLKELQSLAYIAPDGNSAGASAHFYLADALYLHSSSPSPRLDNETFQLDLGASTLVNRDRSSGTAAMLFVHDGN